MKCAVRLLMLVVPMALSVGCGGGVDRRFVIEAASGPGPLAEPVPALVLRDGKPVGPAPADSHFVYYGKYTFTLIADGYETLNVVQDVDAPWYAYPPLDFFAETLWPFRISDVRRYRYALQPRQQVRTDEVKQRAGELRQQGQAIGDPPAPPAPP